MDDAGLPKDEASILENGARETSSSIADVLANYMTKPSQDSEGSGILSTLGEGATGQDPLAGGASSAGAPRVAAAPGAGTAAASPLEGAGSADAATDYTGLSRKERGELVKLERKAGLSSSVIISDDGSSSAKFNHFLHHFNAVGAQADHAEDAMVKHRKLEKSAAAAVHKIQAEEDKSAASSDSALLAITSILGKFHGMGLLADPTIRKTLRPPSA